MTKYEFIIFFIKFKGLLYATENKINFLKWEITLKELLIQFKKLEIMIQQNKNQKVFKYFIMLLNNIKKIFFLKQNSIEETQINYVKNLLISKIKVYTKNAFIIYILN